jgi:hypothetical protein
LDAGSSGFGSELSRGAFEGPDGRCLGKPTLSPRAISSRSTGPAQAGGLVKKFGETKHTAINSAAVGTAFFNLITICQSDTVNFTASVIMKAQVTFDKGFLCGA